jgi:hypothetical protein
LLRPPALELTVTILYITVEAPDEESTHLILIKKQRESGEGGGERKGGQAKVLICLSNWCLQRIHFL